MSFEPVALLLLTARLVARFFCACGTNALCVRARAVPQKYQMHFLKRNIEATPCFRARPLFHAASDRST